jgi:hypothetical protein
MEDENKQFGKYRLRRAWQFRPPYNEPRNFQFPNAKFNDLKQTKDKWQYYNYILPFYTKHRRRFLLILTKDLKSIRFCW